jgi:hypothetical protein
MCRHLWFSSVLFLALGLCAHGENLAKIPLNANYVPVGDNPEGCPGMIPMRTNSMQSLDFLKRIYRKAQITTEETGVSLSYRYLVHTADLQPNTLVITVSYSKPELLTWDEGLRDKNGKALKKVDGLCANGHYAAPVAGK